MEDMPVIDSADYQLYERTKAIAMMVDNPSIAGTPSRTHDAERQVAALFIDDPQQAVQIWESKTRAIQHPEHHLFQDPRHSHIVSHILKRVEQGDYDMDPLSLILEMRAQGVLDQSGGSSYVHSLVSEWYLGMDFAKASLERLLSVYAKDKFSEIAGSLAEKVHQGISVENAVTEMISKTRPLIRVEAKMTKPSTETVEQAIAELIDPDMIALTQIPSAYKALGDHYKHMQRSQIILVGARTGSGKTAFAMAEIRNSARNGFTSDNFLMESTFRQFTERWIAAKTLLPANMLPEINKMADHATFRGKTKEQLLDEVSDAGKELALMKPYMNFSPARSLSVTEIDQMIQDRKARTGQPCDLIVIDHLNAVKSADGESQSDYNHWVRVSQELKDLASKENAAVLVTSQLTTEAVRANLKGSGKLPTIGVFRGGAPTEAAKVCVVIHKDEQSIVRGCPVLEQKMVIVKANDGSLGVVDSLFVGPTMLHIEDHPPRGEFIGKRWDIAAWRRNQGYAELLDMYGYDHQQSRKDDGEEE